LWINYNNINKDPAVIVADTKGDIWIKNYASLINKGATLFPDTSAKDNCRCVYNALEEPGLKEFNARYGSVSLDISLWKFLSERKVKKNVFEWEFNLVTVDALKGSKEKEEEEDDDDEDDVKDKEKKEKEKKVAKNPKDSYTLQDMIDEVILKNLQGEGDKEYIHKIDIEMKNNEFRDVIENGQKIKIDISKLTDVILDIQKKNRKEAYVTNLFKTGVYVFPHNIQGAKWEPGCYLSVELDIKYTLFDIT